MPESLDLAWADKRWYDPGTGTEVVCLSPPGRAAHFRNNYFHLDMFTADSRFAVFCQFAEIRDGYAHGANRLWARDLTTGELRDLGPVHEGNVFPRSDIYSLWAVGPRSHRVIVVDQSDPEAESLVAIDIDTGSRRRIAPSQRLHINTPKISADEKTLYTNWLKEALQPSAGGRLGDDYERLQWDPGYQEMVGIDLESGEVRTVFSATDWYMGHPNPHPRDRDLLMCCQVALTQEAKNERYERIRVFDLRAGEWLDPRRRVPLHGFHESWGREGRRIYAHDWIHKKTHAINRIDLDTGQNEWFACLPDVGCSSHVRPAPNETFLVGDGRNFDQSMPDDIRAKLEAIAAALDRDDWASTWFLDDLRRCTNGGETIWKYELPSQSLWDFDTYGLWTTPDKDPEVFYRDLLAHPDQAVATTPVCGFRTLCRTHMMGQRLESNAHVTPDSRWVVFQSSNEDDWFEVWAARVPGTG